MATKNVLSFGSNIGFDTDIERYSINFIIIIIIIIFISF